MIHWKLIITSVYIKMVIECVSLRAWEYFFPWCFYKKIIKCYQEILNIFHSRILDLFIFFPPEFAFVFYRFVSVHRCLWNPSVVVWPNFGSAHCALDESSPQMAFGRNYITATENKISIMSMWVTESLNGKRSTVTKACTKGGSATHHPWLLVQRDSLSVDWAINVILLHFSLASQKLNHCLMVSYTHCWCLAEV